MHGTLPMLINKPVKPYKWKYVETIPILGKNYLEKSAETLRAKRLCLHETEQMFACLRKWEMDDLQCVDAKEAMLRCAHENAMHIRDQKKRMFQGDQQKMHISSEGSKVRKETDRLMLSEIDSLFRKFKQPDINMGFRPKKRLPHVPYWEHIGPKSQKQTEP